jgi:cytochrome b6-f complex iron-sulfur subunit
VEERSRRPASAAGMESKPAPAVNRSDSSPGQAAAVAGKTSTKKPPIPANQPNPSTLSEHFQSRRRLVWTIITGILTTSFLMFVRFLFPRTLFEPSTRFRVGFPSDFLLGVDERFKQSHRIWVVRRPDKLFVLYARCTHLGCTPNWVETENKFKCPCHGSGYDMEGINFEGPAPRPMDRAQVELDAEGQIVVDTSRLYKCPPDEQCEFDTDASSYLILSS